MKKISVVEILGTPILLSTDKGKSLFYIIIDELKHQKNVILDFSGYEYISTTFLNNSIGDLIVTNNWNVETFNQHITIVGLPEDDLDDLYLAISNARYRKDLMDKGLNPKDIYEKYMIS
jgi:STAS-like domain of unknown function (DUF4325)